MKRFLFIIPLLLLPILAAAQADTIAHEQGMPLFIVDGKVGMSKSDIPSPDEIASITFMSYEEGVELYGKRATNGVLIIRTKNYEKEHVVKKEHVVQTSPAVQKAQSKQLPRWARWVVLFFLELLLIVFLLSTRSRWIGTDEDLPLDDLPEISPAMKRKGYDKLFIGVAFHVVEKQTTDKSLITKRFSISPDRAERILSQLEKEGIVGPPETDGTRKVPFLDVAELSPILDRLGVR